MRTRKHSVRVTTDAVLVSEQSTVDLPRPAAVMWERMWDPSSNVELFGAERGLTLPGTPERAVGEIQVIIHRSGAERSATMVEVVELEPGRRAVTRDLTSGYPAGSVLTIDPLDADSCRLTQTFTAQLPAGTPVEYVGAARENFTMTLLAMMQRLRELTSEPDRPEAGRA